MLQIDTAVNSQHPSSSNSLCISCPCKFSTACKMHPAPTPPGHQHPTQDHDLAQGSATMGPDTWHKAHTKEVTRGVCKQGGHPGCRYQL